MKRNLKFPDFTISYIVCPVFKRPAGGCVQITGRAPRCGGPLGAYLYPDPIYLRGPLGTHVRIWAPHIPMVFPKGRRGRIKLAAHRGPPCVYESPIYLGGTLRAPICIWESHIPEGRIKLAAHMGPPCVYGSPISLGGTLSAPVCIWESHIPMGSPRGIPVYMGIPHS